MLVTNTLQGCSWVSSQDALSRVVFAATDRVWLHARQTTVRGVTLVMAASTFMSGSSRPSITPGCWS